MQPDAPEKRIAHSVQHLARGWTTEHMQRVYGKKGRQLITVRHEPLISMLRTAGTASLGAAASSPSARMLADADAIEKFRQLGHSIAGLWAELAPGAVAAGVLRSRDLTPEAALIGWHKLFTFHHSAHLVKPAQAERAASTLGGWVNAIEVRFDPPTIIESTSPCPRCGRRWAESSVGDRVAAIVYTIGRPLDLTSATCRAKDCGHTWRGAVELRELTRLQGVLYG